MDNINPDHYKNETSLECKDAMRIMFGDDAYVGFCLVNAWKYIWRWTNKNGEEDLHKAQWYLDEVLELNKQGYSSSYDQLTLVSRMKRYIAENLGEEVDGNSKEV